MKILQKIKAIFLNKKNISKGKYVLINPEDAEYMPNYYRVKSIYFTNIFNEISELNEYIENEIPKSQKESLIIMRVL